jgi:hypothetical protein
LPEDIVKILLQVFQTSSVDDFNSTFLLMEKQRKQQAVLRRTGSPPDLSPSDIFKIAESEYRDMQTLNTWTGVHTKGDSAFHAGNRPPPNGGSHFTPDCFNCGEAHHVKQCPKPRDEAKINQKAAEFKVMLRKKFASRKNSGGGGGDKSSADAKWAAPQSHENNRRTIDGKPMFYLRFRKRWVPDTGTKPSAHLSTKKKKKAVEEAAPPPAAATSGSDPDRVLMANRFKQMQATFTAFSNDMLNS